MSSSTVAPLRCCCTLPVECTKISLQEAFLEGDLAIVYMQKAKSLPSAGEQLSAGFYQTGIPNLGKEYSTTVTEGIHGLYFILNLEATSFLESWNMPNRF